MDRVYIATIHDLADFDKVIGKLAFTTWTEAEKWATQECARLRAENYEEWFALGYEIEPVIFG